MKRNERIQVTMPTKTKEWVIQYQQDNGLQFTSDAVLELLEFAIRIKDNAKNDDTISNRELLESILENVLIGQRVSRNVLGYAYIKGKLQEEGLMSDVKKLIDNAKNKAMTEKESILIKNKDT
ncbi:hypothetical protein HC723_11060 [Vibrio sp. S11_S32]|uniref:hypothetical protein n=1 Tax=Vibrio sp. S11_S32 TaxID=2720225 RepID=UPI00168106E0|nr:hypothetical protein [Vibrio sp. S11_S32]MBD1576968.1 hypothetical protein [Vibrio sp. S11_S32]